jgi:tetratricopeptide (TPR) repeat protein
MNTMIAGLCNRHFKLIHPLIGVLILNASSWCVSAADNGDVMSERVTALERLVLAQRYQEAYEYGRPLESDWEGSERFDFAYGLAALEQGEFSKAVFALERAQSTNPNQKRYRLELARAYFYSKNFDASEREFQQILETKPPAVVESNINQFLDRIERLRNRQETTYSALLELGAGYDSNVNSGPYLGRVPGDQLSFNQSLRLNDDAKEQDSNFFGLLASGGVLYPLDQRDLIDARVTGISRNNASEKDYDLDAVFFDAGYAHRFYDVHRVRMGIRYQRSFLAGSGFLKSPGLNLGWNFMQDTGWYFGAQWDYSQYRYDDATSNNDPDVNQHLFQFSVFMTPSDSREGITVHYGDDRANTSGFDYHSKYFYGIRLQQTTLFNFFKAGWYLSFDEKRFNDKRPGLSKRRRDTSAAFGMNFLATLMKNVSLNNTYSYTYNFSNLNFYRYRRVKVELALQVDF